MTRIRAIDVAGRLRCTIWHVRGLLVDSGMGLQPLQRAVTLLTEKPATAMTKHGCFDHPGGALEGDRRPGHGARATIHADPGRQCSRLGLHPGRSRLEDLTPRRMQTLSAARAVFGGLGDLRQCLRDQAKGLLSLLVIDHRKCCLDQAMPVRFGRMQVHEHAGP